MSLQCALCPKNCVIRPGQTGECRIRFNLDDRLVAATYGFPCSVHVDPIEKKPLFHFLPGTPSLSLATVGCNLHCKNCQNWEISQQNPETSSAAPLPPEAIPGVARRYGCPSVAYTYTDPVVYYEYALDSCLRCHEAGLRNVLVTAAYINPGPWRELCRHVDGAHIDLKGFSDRFYRDVCDGTLAPVLEALVTAKSMGVHVEVINLVIPTLNDGDEDLLPLCRWIVENMGPDTPLHFSRFFPQYRMQHLPPTPASTLVRAKQIAESAGLRFVYIGNIMIENAEHTFCPACGKLLVGRRRYAILENHVRDGKCGYCGTEICGVWQ